MNKNYLLPWPCKIAGIILAIPFLALGILYVIDSAAGLSDSTKLEFLYRWSFLPTFELIGLALTLMMAAFSREKDEDELTTAVREKSLVTALAINYLIVIVAALFLYDFAFLSFMLAGIFAPLILHTIIFNCRMRRIRKEANHEE